MYMDCAVVTIERGHSKKRSPKGSLHPRATLPSIFVANIGKGCVTVPGKDVDFPSPGTDITYGAGVDPAPPEGDSCGVVATLNDTGNTTSTGTGTGTNNTTTTDTTTSTTLGTVDAAIDGNGATATPDATHDCAYWEERNYVCALGMRLSANLPSMWLLLGVMILWAFIP